jgi:predicted nucleic acid-binding protein
MPKIFKDKVIISDTTCLIAFRDINKLDILKNTFDEIEITPDVKKEYEDKGNVLPNWFKIKEPNDKEWVNKLRNKYGAGESQSIVLAKEEETEGNDVLLIIDDRRARNKAIDMGIHVIRTMAVVDRARRKNLITFDEAENTIRNMVTNNLRVTKEAMEDFIKGMKKDNEKRNTN